MKESLRLGRIAGINVGINWSVLVIFFLISFGLAAGRFPAIYPDLDGATYVIAGLVAGLLFFASLLAHEMSHAIVARSNGVEVEGITLWLFGGVARLLGEARTPGAEFRISAVGPFVSLVAAAVFGAVALALDAADVTGIVVGIFQWLAIINVILAIFNLMPAAPLDGGRILRSFLWARRGDRYSAAITASRAGRTFGWILVGLGFAQFVLGAGLGGLWLVLIGWFLTSAAGAEEQHARVSGALAGLRVADVMTPNPTVAPMGITVDRFIEDYVFPNRYSTFPLTDGGDRLAGLVTLSRVKQIPADRRATTRVDEVACAPDDIPTVDPDSALVDLLPLMSACSDGRAVVVRGGRIVGIVSPTDVMRQLERSELRPRGVVEHV